MSQLVVAVNKMDTVECSKVRFDEVVRKLEKFLRLAGFKVQLFCVKSLKSFSVNINVISFRSRTSFTSRAAVYWETT